MPKITKAFNEDVIKGLSDNLYYNGDFVAEFNRRYPDLFFDNHPNLVELEDVRNQLTPLLREFVRLRANARVELLKDVSVTDILDVLYFK